MGRTQEERKAETRARLLDAAADLFARQGFHATSADAVADAADRTTGALYAHFGSKEGLLAALLSAWATEAAGEVGAALDATDDPADRLDALWRSYRGRADGSDAWMLLEHELWLYAVRNPDAGDALARRYGSARDGMAAAFSSWAAEAGTDLPFDAGTTGTLVLALLLGLDMQRRVDPAAVPDEAAVAGLRRLLGLDAVVPT